MDAAPAAVRLRDRIDDGKPEPDTAVSARPGGVRPRETVEDLRQRIRRDAAAAVFDFDHERLSCGR